ncbi:MAG: sialate O-acetylesterase [Prevotella sp.]|nr:sialate O-acetylesterase [Prevotella sp.]
MFVGKFITKRKFLVLNSSFLILSAVATAKPVPARLFQSGMVLQRGTEVPVWGQADAGEQVSVKFKKKTYTATADASGRWQVMLPSQKAGGPYEIVITGNDAQPQVLKDVLFGDVWLCSGQSNIDVMIERVYPQYGKVVDDYENPNIRMFRVQTEFDVDGPKNDIRPTNINWLPVNKDNAWRFSAVGYFLGREMYEKTGVPQGIIVNSLGGTPIQAWLSPDTLKQRWPEQYARTAFYQDADMVRAMNEANGKAQRRWQQMLDAADPGLSGNYADKNLDDSQWKRTDVFRTVGERQLSRDLTDDRRYNGSLWTRQHFTIDATHAGMGARLLVGTLYDADQTYVNGREVGHTSYQYPPRRYTIPAGVLTEGDNVITVRFTTKGGSPHFIPEKQYKLIFDDGVEVQLSDEWLVTDGARMPSQPGIDSGGQNLPSVLYNAMLYPLAPYPLQGVVWYQGESNTGDGAVYEQYLSQLIGGWRQLWQRPDMPFCVVQLANFLDPSDSPQQSGWAEVREAQRLTSEHMPHVGLAVAIDLGETVDIHPLRKREVAERIANVFDNLVWNKKSPLSPRVTNVQQDGTVITLTADQKLRTVTQLYEFETAGSDGRFRNAEASADGNRIIIRSAVENPVKVRYAWKNNPLRAGIYSEAGVPMSPMQLDLSEYGK